MPKLDELKDKLRRGLGNPSFTELSDEQVTDAVESAIREYSKHKPVRIVDWIATTAGKASYGLSDKKGIIKVREVFYSTGSQLLPEEQWFDVQMLGRLEGISIFENPSVWLQFIQRLERFKSIFEGDFEYDQSGKILTLIPAPSTTGSKVFFIWSKRHTPETIPEDDIDTVLLWAKGEAKEMMASKKGSEIQSVSGYGESVTFGSTSDSLMKESRDFKTRFERKFGGSVFIVG